MTIFVARTIAHKHTAQKRPLGSNAFWRLLVLTALFGLFIMLILGRLATLALFETARAFGATTTDYIPDRGDILDRNNIPLARTIHAYAIWVRPKEILSDRRELSRQLSAIFPDTTADEFYQKLTSPSQGYLRCPKKCSVCMRLVKLQLNSRVNRSVYIRNIILPHMCLAS
jgi:cell division protein FtsI (penicillin-binding protein 3)